MRTLAAIALLFVLTGTSSGASITPTPERSAIYGCIERETRAAVESKWGQNGEVGLRAEIYREGVAEEVSNESGEVTDFQKSIWQECSQRLPRDAALIGQKDAAAWVRKTLDELSFEKDTKAYGEQKASEMRALNQAGDAYDKCLEANARSLALATFRRKIACSWRSG